MPRRCQQGCTERPPGTTRAGPDRGSQPGWRYGRGDPARGRLRGEVTLLGAEYELPYERPELSKRYLAGEVNAGSLRTYPAAFYRDHRITLRLGKTAAGLDTARRLVRLVRLASGDQLPYGTLVIATGASNTRPPIPGLDLTGVHQLRTLADADRLRSALAGVSSAVVVGMGFIGWEITATHLPWRRGHRRRRRPGLLWTALGPELSAVIRRWHEERGVRILTDQSVTAFRPNLSGSTVAAVELASGERLHAGLVVVGVGARPNTGWLADTPLHLAAGRAIGVDQHRPHHSSRDLGGRRRPRHLGPGQRKPPSARAWASAIEQAQRAARAIAGTPTKPAAAPYLGRE